MYTSLKIENFKSIKSLDLPLKRVNVLIGEPNTGKSNILEACALMGTGYLCLYDDYLRKALRFSKIPELFFLKNPNNNPIDVRLQAQTLGRDILTYQTHITYNLGTNAGNQTLLFSENGVNAENDFPYQAKKNSTSFIHNKIRDKTFSTSDKGDEEKWEQLLNSYALKYYNFAKFDLSNSNKHYSDESFLYSLESPFGTNLHGLLNNRTELQEHLGVYFMKYGYRIYIDPEKNRLQFVKLSDYAMLQFDISLAADTLLRMIYYDLALRTNKDAFLLLEEPEAYSYPTYVSELAYEIANDEHNNQYLLTTHSPHMIYKLIDELSYDELNIVGVYFEDFQTKVKVFTEDELGELLDMGYDLFFSLPSVLSRTTEPA